MMEPSFFKKGVPLPMYRKSEILILSVLGCTRSDIRPLACALDIIVDLLFIQRIPKSDIHVTKDVYPQVAARTGKTIAAVSRSIVRMANLCWDTARSQDRLIEVFGRPLCDAPSSADILFYLAFLLHFGQPFFSVLDDLDRLNSPT